MTRSLQFTKSAFLNLEELLIILLEIKNCGVNLGSGYNQTSLSKPEVNTETRSKKKKKTRAKKVLKLSCFSSVVSNDCQDAVLCQVLFTYYTFVLMY